MQVVILGFVDPLELSNHMMDYLFFGLEKMGEVFLQYIDQLIFFHSHSVGTGMGVFSIVAGTGPADIGVFIGADDAPERQTALFAFNERGEQILVALPLLVHPKRFTPGLHDLLCLLKGLWRDDLQLGPVYYQPLGFVFFGTASREKIRYLFFSVDHFSRIQLIGKDAADSILAPLAVAFCFQDTIVEHRSNL